ncbi:MAG: PQQ-dependent sugar dehydrogenase [Polyangiaceae bacterium]
MRRSIVLFLMGTAAALSSAAGCGDDTQTGGSGGTGASAQGGSGGNPTTGGAGGNPVTGGAGGTGGDVTMGGGGSGGGSMGPGYSCDPPTGTIPALTLTEIAAFDRVVQIKSAPGAPDRVFIVRKNGIIRIYENGALVDTPFIDVSGLIRGGGSGGDEEGLLGLAFHPNYAQNGKFYLHYSAAGNGDSTVREFHVSADPLVADPNPGQLVFSHFTAEGNHNGGAVEFGNDGYLYISMGDGGAQGDPGCDAMNTENLLGKIMRVDVDGTPDANGYPAAPGNPNGAKYYHIAMRNPWRISFDACTGDLYIGDVGQNAYEEVDVVPQVSGPVNFGWPVREGLHAYSGYDGSCTNVPPTFVDPVTELSHNAGNCSMTGGYVYRGSKIPALRGAYFYGDYCSGSIYTIRTVNGNVTEPAAATTLHVDNLSAFGIDGNGELYAADHGGFVYRIDPQ